jgi:hypothetical protein
MKPAAIKAGPESLFMFFNRPKHSSEGDNIYRRNVNVKREREPSLKGSDFIGILSCRGRELNVI